MPDPSTTPHNSGTSMAGGFLIALGALLGAAIGFLFGQATPGCLIGAGCGIALAVIVWLIDRRR